MVIIITGLTGSGKTEAANIISNKCSSIIVNTDKVREIIFDGVKADKSGDFTDEHLKYVYRSLPAILYYTKIFNGSRCVVFDGSFRLRKQRCRLRNMSKMICDEVVTMKIVATPSIVKKRLKKRKEREGQSGVYNTYLKVKSEYEEPDQALEISNEGTLSELEDKLINKLRQLGLV